MQPVPVVHHRLHGGGACLRNRRRRRCGAFVNGEQHRTVAAYLGIAVVGVVGDLYVGHVGQAHVANAVNAAQHHAFQRVGAVKGIAYLYNVAVVVARTALNVPGGHREVLRRDQLLQGVHVQQLVQVGVFQRFLAGRLVLFLGGIQLGLASLQLGAAAFQLELPQL